MHARLFVVVLSLVVCVQTGWAASFRVKADTGVVLLWQAKTNYWAAIKDSAPVGFNDSLYVDDKYRALLSLGSGCVVLIRGESRLCIKGADTGVGIYLDQGQIFLKREAPGEVNAITIVTRGCTITPIGTAAAIKLTKVGEPSVAVLRGKIRMESSKGESIVIEPGKFGTYSPDAGTFKQGAIPPEAITGLENWSGVITEVAAATPFKGDSGTSTNDVGAMQPAPAQPASAGTTAALPAAKPLEKTASTSETGNQTTTGQGPASVSGSSPVPVGTPGKSEEKPAVVGETEKKEPAAKETGAQRISWEVSASSVTVGGQQWTRLAVSPDIPIWKFGVGLDLELFLDQNGNFSRKSWEFDKDNLEESLLRKIKYLRFGHENDPLFVKVGGLSNVTLGYGFIVDRFTNMLYYPDQKLVGVQFYLNNLSPLGITLQTMTPDVQEFQNNGGIVAARLALMPLKISAMPLLKNLSIGGTYAIDLNEFAPARDWSYGGKIWDKNGNGKVDWDYAYQQAHNAFDSSVVRRDIQLGLVDTSTTKYLGIDTTYRDTVRRYALLGVDAGLPLISTSLLGLEIYGQAGAVADSNLFGHQTGWGFGAPGARLTIGPLMAQVEYRHIRGRFSPEFFGPYYLDERLQRNPQPPGPMVKSDSLGNNNLDGIFGKLGFNVVNLVMIDGSYQYMAGTNDALDQRFEARGGLGDAILKRIPKINKAEFYFYKTDINRTVVVYTNKGKPYLLNGKVIYDDFLEMTPTLYWGYRVGFEVTKGASIIWDTRYGYKWNEAYRLVPNNQMTIQTAVTF
jgi:hypothetical protein